MDSSSTFLLSIAGVLILGLASASIGRHSFVPRVTLMLLFGLLLGESGLDLIPRAVTDSFGLVADIALVMIGFLIGSQLTVSLFRTSTREVLCVSIITALLTAGATCCGLWLLGFDPALALLLGCIASATAPAAVYDVVGESGVRTHFSRLLLAVVALDDIWAVLLFSVGMALVAALEGAGGQLDVLLHAGRDVGGALLLGGAVGVPASYLTGRVRPGEPILTEALALVFLCGGLALWLDVSYLVAAMTLGATVANLAAHHEYPFHAIEDVEQPFLVVFFVLAGASLDLGAVEALGVLGVAYLGLRSGGKIAGAWVGGVAGASSTGRWMGVALLPQAGVAIGMALAAANRFPAHGATLLTLVIASTVVFELVGPVFTRLAIMRSPDGATRNAV